MSQRLKQLIWTSTLLTGSALGLAACAGHPTAQSAPTTGRVAYFEAAQLSSDHEPITTLEDFARVKHQEVISGTITSFSAGPTLARPLPGTLVTAQVTSSNRKHQIAVVVRVNGSNVDPTTLIPPLDPVVLVAGRPDDPSLFAETPTPKLWAVGPFDVLADTGKPHLVAVALDEEVTVLPTGGTEPAAEAIAAVNGLPVS